MKDLLTLMQTMFLMELAQRHPQRTLSSLAIWRSVLLCKIQATSASILQTLQIKHLLTLAYQDMLRKTFSLIKKDFATKEDVATGGVLTKHVNYIRNFEYIRNVWSYRIDMICFIFIEII